MLLFTPKEAGFLRLPFPSSHPSFVLCPFPSLVLPPLLPSFYKIKASEKLITEYIWEIVYKHTK